MTVVMQASFGWGWLSDLMEEVGLNARPAALAPCVLFQKWGLARESRCTSGRTCVYPFLHPPPSPPRSLATEATEGANTTV